jgi:hypothetical protein
MLTGVLAEETDDDVEARLVANLLTATITSIFHIPIDRIMAGDDVEQVRRDQVAVIDRAFDVLEQGISHGRDRLHSGE